MQLRNGKRKLDAYRPTFDPHLDIATVVFSHVQCVKTRVNLAVVSKLWRDASKPAAAYPLRFDFGVFPVMDEYPLRFDIDAFWHTDILRRVMVLLDNDGALSLPYERVVGLLGEAAEQYGTRMVKLVSEYAASRGSVRLLKWTRVNNLDWSTQTCCCAANKGHQPALQYLHENGCPWDWDTSMYAAAHKHWDCLQYAVDNKCPGWEDYAEHYAEHLR